MERQDQRLGEGAVQTPLGAHDLFLRRGLHLRQHLGPCFLWHRLWKRRSRISLRKQNGI